MAVKLRKPANGVPPTDPTVEASAPIFVRQLEISGFLISKRALLATLSSLVPNLRDILVFEDGQEFVLVLGPAASDDGGAS